MLLEYLLLYDSDTAILLTWLLLCLKMIPQLYCWVRGHHGVAENEWLTFSLSKHWVCKKKKMKVLHWVWNKHVDVGQELGLTVFCSFSLKSFVFLSYFNLKTLYAEFILYDLPSSIWMHKTGCELRIYLSSLLRYLMGNQCRITCQTYKHWEDIIRNSSSWNLSWD